MVEVILLLSRLKWSGVGDINRVSSVFWYFLEFFLVIHNTFLDFLAPVTYWHHLVTIRRASDYFPGIHLRSGKSSLNPWLRISFLDTWPCAYQHSVHLLKCTPLRALWIPLVVLPAQGLLETLSLSQTVIKTVGEWMHYQHSSLFRILCPKEQRINIRKVSVAHRSFIFDDHYLYYWSFSVYSECEVLHILLNVPHYCYHPPISSHILLGCEHLGEALEVFF